MNLLKPGEIKERGVKTKDRTTIIRYERNENGEVEFMFIIDLADFLPEEIGINQTGYHLTIKANRITIPGSLRKSKDFCEIVTLPKNTDMSKELEAQFNSDGNLIVKIQIIPRFFSSSTYMNPKQRFPPSPLLDDEKMSFVERITIDQEFKDADIKVNVDGNIIHILAGIEIKNEFGDVVVKEYHEQCSLPSYINPEDLRADYMNGVLTLTAANKSISNSVYGSLRSGKTRISALSDVFQF